MQPHIQICANGQKRTVASGAEENLFLGKRGGGEGLQGNGGSTKLAESVFSACLLSQNTGGVHGQEGKVRRVRGRGEGREGNRGGGGEGKKGRNRE